MKSFVKMGCPHLQRFSRVGTSLSPVIAGSFARHQSTPTADHLGAAATTTAAEPEDNTAEEHLGKTFNLIAQNQRVNSVAIFVPVCAVQPDPAAPTASADRDCSAGSSTSGDGDCGAASASKEESDADKVSDTQLISSKARNIKIFYVEII